MRSLRWIFTVRWFASVIIAHFYESDSSPPINNPIFPPIFPQTFLRILCHKKSNFFLYLNKTPVMTPNGNPMNQYSSPNKQSELEFEIFRVKILWIIMNERIKKKFEWILPKYQNLDDLIIMSAVKSSLQIKYSRVSGAPMQVHGPVIKV